MMVGYRILSIGVDYWPLAIGHWLLPTAYCLPGVGYWLLNIENWLLTGTGYWPR